MNQPVTESDRREIFRTLVTAQDSGVSVVKSREQVAAQFELTSDEMHNIERAGIAAKWPPLDGQ